MLCLCCALTGRALAAPHEIEVFTDEITGFKEHALEVHANVSRSRADATAAKRTVFQAMPEYSYGVARNWDVSVQLPTSHTNGAFYSNGINVELQFIAPHHEQNFYWGFNTELRYASPVAERQFWTVEIISILGRRVGRWHGALNLGIEIPLSGEQRTVTFEPAAMLTYAATARSSVGLEYYADLGPLRRFAPRDEQSRTVYAVWNYRGRGFDVNAGVGRGLTDSSDRWVLKTIFGFEFE